MNRFRSQESNDLTSGSLLARNAYINLVGQVLPILVAILAIPLLIKDMGQDRFGLLALAWSIMGYFGLFDFGLSRATTKFVAEYQARGEPEIIPGLVWSSTISHAALGLLGGGILALLTLPLTNSILNIPTGLLAEARITFYLLAFSVPLVVTTAALRGVLEAVQRFDLINVVKIPASMINYLGPLPILLFTDSLVSVIGFLVFSRLLVLLVYLVFCLRVMPSLLHGFGFEFMRIKPLLGFGGWLTVSNFVVPSIASIDRFMIGAFVSLSAVTLYATPFEVVTKLTVFSASLLSVLFPAFSALSVGREHDLRRLYGRACKYLLVLVAPIVGVLMALAYDLLSLWVTPNFASHSAPVAQWLAVGVLIRVLASVPTTVLQGIGRADVTAKLQLLQLPLYAAGVWYAVDIAGIVGVAIVWTVRAAVDAVMMFVATRKLLPATADEREARFSWAGVPVFCGALLVFLGIGSTLSGEIVAKVAMVGSVLIVFILWEWFFYLQPADRAAFLKAAKPLQRAISKPS